MSDDLKLLLKEIGKLDQKTDLMREDMKQMEGSLREDMSQMEDSLREEIKDGDRSVRMILENDIRPKINILAENHLNLNNKLDVILKELHKYELLSIRVSLLETEVFN